MYQEKCPGAKTFREPVPELVNCPTCGSEIEIWSDETKARCSKCGQVYKRAMQLSCLDWCPMARECVGEEAYQKYLEEKGAS